MKHDSMLIGACLLLCLSMPFKAQQPDAASHATQPATAGDEPTAILELGASSNWNFSGGAVTFAPNTAIEVTPIDNWLELEAGLSPFFTHNSTEWDTDLLFKKPWTLTNRAEFMFGAGPQWSHIHQKSKISDTISAEIAGDFMFWPSGRHRFGWYLEPAYHYSFAGGHPQSIGMSTGLLIGIHRRPSATR